MTHQCLVRLTDVEQARNECLATSGNTWNNITIPAQKQVMTGRELVCAAKKIEVVVLKVIHMIAPMPGVSVVKTWEGK